MRLAPAVIGLVTADLPASLAFYRDLGIAVPEGADAAPHVDVEVGENLRIAWDTYDTVRSFDPAWTPSSGGHRIALCFACDSADEVDAVYAAMTARGHTGHIAPWDAVWRQRYAVLHDPDGNPVELFAPLT
jgi:catechol 2,3-dioxygenase-like lactoylglutathione lyase family enzyme